MQGTGETHIKAKKRQVEVQHMCLMQFSDEYIYEDYGNEFLCEENY